MLVEKDSQLLARAAAFAAVAHSTQKRKASDEPYINHSARVARMAAECGLPTEAIAAAYLHDVVEDTHITFEDLEYEFPRAVVELVRLLTQWWPDQAPEEVKRSEAPKYYAAISRDPNAISLKLLDRADNLHDMKMMLPRARRWAESYLKRTEEEVLPLSRRCESAKARAQFLECLESLRKALQEEAIPRAA
jgi:GTP diphosphokinase / guanosine-3',5'-bis(diphosphate) 3'-diphosphatase